jgi:hypothetical protein
VVVVVVGAAAEVESEEDVEKRSAVMGWRSSEVEASSSEASNKPAFV